jgi:hypothetical protein
MFTSETLVLRRPLHPAYQDMPRWRRTASEVSIGGVRPGPDGSEPVKNTVSQWPDADDMLMKQDKLVPQANSSPGGSIMCDFLGLLSVDPEQKIKIVVASIVLLTSATVNTAGQAPLRPTMTANMTTFPSSISIPFGINAVASKDNTSSLLLVSLIAEERRVAQVDDENLEAANDATTDATTLALISKFSELPRVMFSDDGILTLQWQRGEFGAALIFAGDGMVSIALKRPGQFYAENGMDVAISEELPGEFYAVLATMSS